MNVIEIINKKKNKMELTIKEIEFVIQGYLKDTIPDYQISALLMAVWFNGMNNNELANLTEIMARSGKIVNLSAIPGKKVDKHSTGGVGDKTTIALLPMVAAAGLSVPKISGRGLGHTGGTIDKLESISGFKTDLTIDRFIEIVKEIHCSIISTNFDLAPADKKLYALRDVTGTIDSIPLIASSIMSKKIAGGADALVLNVTFGSGAFLRKYMDAIQLGKEMVHIGENNHKQTYIVVSSMDQPLGFAVGNSLELQEAISLLNNQGPEDLMEICLFIGSIMLIAGGIVKQQKDGIEILKEVIENGQAFDKLKEMVKRQGGDQRQIENPELLPKSKYKDDIYSDFKGYIHKIDARSIGEASMLLGAGREQKNSTIDLSVGIILKKKKGDSVKKGEILATLHYNDHDKFEKVHDKVKSAFDIRNKKPAYKPLIVALIDRYGVRKPNLS
ncbi:MAG: thymidine phosphorylase [Candidatus Atribacteria bacterium]|nr:thymidine phosphorylase [Candidatus Atribacteria bacterium]